MGSNHSKKKHSKKPPQSRTLLVDVNSSHFTANPADPSSRCRQEPVTLDDFDEIQFPVARVRQTGDAEKIVVGNVYDINTLIACANLNGKYPDNYDRIKWSEIEAISWSPQTPPTLREGYSIITEDILDNLKQLEIMSMHPSIDGQVNTLKDSILRKNYKLFRIRMHIRRTQPNCPHWISSYWDNHPETTAHEFTEDTRNAMLIEQDRFLDIHVDGDQYRAWRLSMAREIQKPLSLWYQYWVYHPITPIEASLNPSLHQSMYDMGTLIESMKLNENGRRTASNTGIDDSVRGMPRRRFETTFS